VLAQHHVTCGRWLPVSPLYSICACLAPRHLWTLATCEPFYSVLACLAPR